MTIKVYSWDDDQQEIFAYDVELPPFAGLTTRQAAILTEDGVMQQCPGLEDGNRDKQIRVDTILETIENQVIILDAKYSGDSEIHFYVCYQDFIKAKALAETELAAWQAKNNG